VVQDEPVNTGSDRWSNAPPSRACNLAMSGSPRQRRSGSTRCATAGGPDLTLGVPGETGFEGEPFSLRSGDRIVFSACRRTVSRCSGPRNPRRPRSRIIVHHDDLMGCRRVRPRGAARCRPPRPLWRQVGGYDPRPVHAQSQHVCTKMALQHSRPDVGLGCTPDGQSQPTPYRSPRLGRKRDQAYSCCGGASTMPKSTWSARNTRRSTGRIC